MSRDESISQITGTNIQMFSDKALKFVLRALSLSRPRVFEWNRKIDLESFHRCFKDQMLKIHKN